MSTNYYHRTNICSCCDRYDETHIGKNTSGFEAVIDWDTDDGRPVMVVSTWQEWKERLLAGGEVYDEYGTRIPTDEFIAERESLSMDARRRQYDWMAANRPSEISWVPERDHTWLDPEGFTFYGGEFS